MLRPKKEAMTLGGGANPPHKYSCSTCDQPTISRQPHHIETPLSKALRPSFPAATSMSGPTAPQTQPRPTTPRVHRHGFDGLSVRSKTSSGGSRMISNGTSSDRCPRTSSLRSSSPIPLTLKQTSKSMGSTTTTFSSLPFPTRPPGKRRCTRVL